MLQKRGTRIGGRWAAEQEMTRVGCSSVWKGRTGRGENGRVGAGGAIVIGQDNETWASIEADFAGRQAGFGFQ